MKATLSLSRKINLLFSHKVFFRSALILSFSVFLFLGGAGKASANTMRWMEMSHGVVDHAYRAGAMMIQKDKISILNQTYGTSMFDGTKWTDVGTPSPRGDNVGNMFLDSRGIIYVGGKKTDDGLLYIFESTDGLNWTPVQQFVDASGSGYIWNFTEDKYGNVWAGEYISAANSTGAHLWRRKPDGTWMNVANWLKSVTGDVHIHNTYYDPYRDALYLAIGDSDRGILKLSSDKVNADTLSISDFSVIKPAGGDDDRIEFTAITSDASYIYAAMDTHTATTNTRSLVRIVDNNVDTPMMEYIYLTGEGALGCTVWNWAHVDDNGVIIFYANGTTEFTCTSGHFINRIVASSDHGTTWQVVKDFGNTYGSITGSNGSVGLPSYYATNWSGLYGFGNGWGGVPLRAIIGRVVPVNQAFYVDGANGVDWTNFGISPSRPIKTLGYLETLGIQPGDSVNFIGTNTYTNPLIAGWSGDSTGNILLRGNTTSIFSGGSLATTPAVAETFESAKGSWNFTLGEAGGSITADTSIFHEGAQSAKVVRGASGTTSLSLKNVSATDIKEGETMYASYWFYYPTDQTSGSDQNLFRILDNSSYELRVLIKNTSTSSYQNEIILNTPQNGNFSIPIRKSLTSGAWHKMYIEDYLHSTNGNFKMYIDNQLVISANGIKTVTASGKLGSVYFYPYQNPITFYIDDFKFGKAPFDDRGSINTNDYNYLDFGNLNLSGVIGSVISSNSSNINLHNSIFSNLTNDALVNNGSSNINLFNNTIFNSGRYGLSASGNATFKNNVIYNSTTNDVSIGAGATVTGSNNWFQSSSANGSGSYSDQGNTTWSAGDPAFVNSGSGNFNLLSSSSLINAGTPVGLTTDYAGNPVPSGALPDIGAYEFQDSTVPVTIASIPTGTYNSASVTLTCDDGEGMGCDKIYYTTNGDVPTTSSTQYSEAINIFSTATLKFFSQDRNSNSETYQTRVYTIDSDAPTLSASSPSGTFDSGTTSATLSLTTDETATCKYGTIANSTYANIPNTFTTTNSTSHSQTLTNLAAGDYNYYVRCQDSLINTNATDYEISFSIAPEENKTSLNATEIKIDKKTSKFKDKIYAKKKEIKLQGQDSNVANGLVKIYKNNKLWKTIEVGANGVWSKLLKFKDSFLGSLKIRQYDQYGTLLNSQKEKVQIDTEKPEIFTASPLYIKHHGSILAWTANDNNKIDYYKVVIAGRTIKTKQPQFIIPSYAPKGSQMITISAYDRAGNKTSVQARLVVSW